jgi:hypothetical protein
LFTSVHGLSVVILWSASNSQEHHGYFANSQKLHVHTSQADHPHRLPANAEQTRPKNKVEICKLSEPPGDAVQREKVGPIRRFPSQAPVARQFCVASADLTPISRILD